jgi:hypothetical protein
MAPSTIVGLDGGRRELHPRVLRWPGWCPVDVGRQTNFFALDEDLAVVLRIATSAGYAAVDEILCAGDGPRRRDAEAARPTKHGRFFLLPPDADLSRLEYTAPVEEAGTRALAWWRAPVIEVIVSSRHGSALECGRIYLPTSSSYTPIEARHERAFPSLPKVYARMARATKAWPRHPQDGRFRIGPAAMEEVRSGSLDVSLRPAMP